jgi:hypothetical protein
MANEHRPQPVHVKTDKHGRPFEVWCRMGDPLLDRILASVAGDDDEGEWVEANP